HEFSVAGERLGPGKATPRRWASFHDAFWRLSYLERSGHVCCFQFRQDTARPFLGRGVPWYLWPRVPAHPNSYRQSEFSGWRRGLFGSLTDPGRPGPGQALFPEGLFADGGAYPTDHRGMCPVCRRHCVRFAGAKVECGSRNFSSAGPDHDDLCHNQSSRMAAQFDWAGGKGPQDCPGHRALDDRQLFHRVALWANRSSPGLFRGDDGVGLAGYSLGGTWNDDFFWRRTASRCPSAGLDHSLRAAFPGGTSVLGSYTPGFAETHDRERGHFRTVLLGSLVRRRTESVFSGFAAIVQKVPGSQRETSQRNLIKRFLNGPGARKARTLIGPWKRTCGTTATDSSLSGRFHLRSLRRHSPSR